MQNRSAFILLLLALAAPAFAAAPQLPLARPAAPQAVAGPGTAELAIVRTILVRVVDSDGGVVTDAEIVVDNGLRRGAAAASAPGVYELALSSGRHLVTIYKRGFSAETREVVVPRSGDLIVDVTLAPARVTEQITVTGAPRFETPAPISGARMPIPTLDLPQSVDVVPQAMLKTQAALSLQDALMNVAGVTPNLGEGRRDQVAVRGFSTMNDSYVDGVRDDAKYYRDLSNIESVEVVKGSASALYGRGSTGGLINRITKKPLFGQRIGEIDLTVGSYERRRLQGDVGRTIGRRAAFRITGAFEDGGSHRPNYSLTRYALAPSLTWRPADRTEVLVQTDFLDDDRIPDRGIPSHNGRPIDAARGNYFGAPGNDFLRNRVAAEALTLEQTLSPAWRLRNVFRHTTYRNAFSNTQPGSAKLVAGRLVAARTQYNTDATQRNLFSQTELVTTALTGPVAHTALFGLELGRESSATTLYRGTVADVDVLSPVLTPARHATTPSTDRMFLGTVSGAYVQEHLSVGRWRALIGARFDRFAQTLDDVTPENRDFARTDRAFSPRAGVVFRARPSTSLYASYSRSFQPSGDGLSLAANTADLKPEQTLSYELGSKSELFAGRLSVALAIFRLDRRNVRTRDPLDSTRLVLVGRQRSDGVELTASGMIVRGWDVRASLGLLDPRILESNDVSSGVPLAGKRIGNAAKQTASLWSTFAVTPRLMIGGGLFRASDLFASNDNLVVLDGYTRADAMIAYRLGRYELALNVRNLLDASYYESAQGNTQIMPAAGRNALATLRYKW